MQFTTPFCNGWLVPGGDEDHDRYQSAASHYAPDVRVHFLMEKSRRCALLLGSK